MHCIVLYCIALYCIALHYITLHMFIYRQFGFPAKWSDKGRGEKMPCFFVEFQKGPKLMDEP